MSVLIRRYFDFVILICRRPTFRSYNIYIPIPIQHTCIRPKIRYMYLYLSSIYVYGQQFAICTYKYPAYLYTANNSLYVPIPIQHICIRPTILYMYLYLSSISVNSQQFSICTYTYPAYLYTANNLLYVPIPIQHICIWPTIRYMYLSSITCIPPAYLQYLKSYGPYINVNLT